MKSNLQTACAFMLTSLVIACMPALAQVSKMPAYPLIAHNPYFSIWSATDKLNESVTQHWTGKEQSLLGVIRVDGKYYRFMGREQAGPAGAIVHHSPDSLLTAVQTAVDVSATQTTYSFACGAIKLQV